MSKMSRANEIKSFLISAGWGTAKIKSLAGDASFRRYDRINKGKQVAILMDAPPDFENTRPFVALAEHLRSIGLGAPKVYARDYEAGLLLLEDLGDDLLKRVLDREPNKEKLLYQKAVDELVPNCKVVTEPPNEIAEPSIVIEEFDNLAFAIEPAKSSLVIAPNVIACPLIDK